ncbi:MAG: alpha-galactosidase [Oscillospiraceae bacterium]|nr:alpha-galactosidase [Oscillospiraceae bacterium]
MILNEIELISSRGAEHFTGSGGSPRLKWDVENTPERFSLTLHAEAETELKVVRARFSFAFEKGDLLYLNGYQSWTDSRERPVSGRMHSLHLVPRPIVDHYSFDGYGDYRFVRYDDRPGRQHGFSYGYVRRGEELMLLGSLSEESGFTVLRFDTRANTVTLEKDCAGYTFTSEYPVFDLRVYHGTEDTVFDAWFSDLGVAPAGGKRLTGYTSWYNRYLDISEDSIREDLAGFAGESAKPDVFQIDDGYEAAVGDWLTPNEKFPHGMKAAAAAIREAGMLPGIWLAPFTAEQNSALAKEHPDWLLRDENGSAPLGGSNWSGFCGLDIYHPGVRAYLKEVFDTVVRDWGYRLVKLDFLYCACLIPRKDKTRAQVMYDGMRLLRQLAGDALILGCGVPLVPAFGLVDYCRIGCDMSLSWDDELRMRPMHRERASTKNTILNTVFRRHLDGRAFRNDPDVFLLRDDNIRLTPQQREMLATVNALFGGVLFTSDNVAKYDRDKRAVYERLATLSRESFRRLAFEKRGLRIFYTENGNETSLLIPM